MQALNLEKINTYRIKKYLESKGYTVRVNKITKSTNQYKEAYSIYFTRKQPIPTPILDQFYTDFRLISDRNSDIILLLPAEMLVWVLPLFPETEFAAYSDDIQEEVCEVKEVKAVVETKIVNTQNEEIVNTSIIGNIQNRNIQQIFEDNQKIEELYYNPYYNKHHMTEEERCLLEKYIEEEFYDRTNAFRYKEGATRFFLPNEVAMQMYDMACTHGLPVEGKIFIPSCHVGSLVKPAIHKENIIGFEENLYALNIANMIYPELPIYHLRFEQAFCAPPSYSYPLFENDPVFEKDSNKITWLKQYPFDLVISNPVIGKVNNTYQRSLRYSWNSEESIDLVYNELYYIYYGVLLLKPKGLLVVATSTKFMDDDTDIYYQKCKKELFKIAKLEECYRVPSYHFELTDENCDILVFRRVY